MSLYVSIVEELEGASHVMPLGKESTCQYMRHKRYEFSPWVGTIPWRRAGQSTPVFLPGESHGQRSLAGCSLWGHKELDPTEHAHTYIEL